MFRTCSVYSHPPSILIACFFPYPFLHPLLYSPFARIPFAVRRSPFIVYYFFVGSLLAVRRSRSIGGCLFPVGRSRFVPGLWFVWAEGMPEMGTIAAVGAGTVGT
ncbi:hypothetical protein HOY80DRAFT_968291 [Tuber brumale]|nr:hypothetical protein HOY80DRAFT_968291 [Tuber brumale]